MTAIQFIGLETTAFISEITDSVKTSLLSELSQLLKNQSPEYLSADEVCKRLSITKPTLHEWKKRKLIKSYKLGARVYYRWDELQNAMIIND